MSGVDAQAGQYSQHYRAGGKSRNFMPKIQKLEIDVAGNKMPGCSVFDRIGDDPQRAYDYYCIMHPEDERKVGFTAWLYRYFKLKFDYSGHKHLFS